MASKFGIKSKIPVINLKKEISTEAAGKSLKESKPLKLLENKGKTTVKKEICVKNKMSEVKQSKGNAEKVIKEKAAITKKSPLQKPNQRAARSTIETLSKEMVNHLKAEMFQDCKSSTESVDNGGDIFSKKTNGTTSKRIAGERKATSPSLMVQPKNYVPHSSLMLKPTVKKSTVTFKPFKFETSPPKLRRSQSEYDPDFERPKAENIRSLQKGINFTKKDKVDQKMKLTKSSTLSKHTFSGLENKLKKDIPVQSNNLVPPRMSKNVSVENKPAKTLLKSRPLKRSSTINAFDSARSKAENIRPQQKCINIANKDKADQKMKPTKSSTLSKRKELSTVVENNFEKDLPAHSNNLGPSKMSRNLSVENKPSKPLLLKSKPLRRSSTIHAFDSAEVLKKTVKGQKEYINSKRITEEFSFENITPVTPENLYLSQLILEDDGNKQITPKKEMPHRGLVFKLHPTRKSTEKKVNFFTSVD